MLAGVPAACDSPAVIRWGQIAAAYAFLAVLASVIAVVLGGSPMSHPEPWLVLAPRVSHIYSAFIGVAFGALVLVITRLIVPRFEWARTLHTELRPFARGMSLSTIIVVAILSSLGEELFFRGLLQPLVGLIPQAILFGLPHQAPGPARWAWLAWATFFGLILGAIFQLTGSLAGPIAAHALVNAVNLAYLKNYDPDPARKSLGGLLGERS